jgi:hypothetical protein
LNYLGNTKLNRVVSTKITEEERNHLGVIANYLQSLGYIAKANTSEAIRFLLRTSMEWTSSLMDYQKARDVKTRQSNTSIARNPAMTFLGSSSSSNKTGDTDQPPSHGSNIPRGNISSTGNVRQSSHILGNSIEIRTSDDPIGNYNKFLAQKSAGSKTTRNQTGNTSDRIDNVIQPADPSVSQVGKNLTDASGPSLEFFGKYLRLKQSLGLTINSQF